MTSSKRIGLDKDKLELANDQTANRGEQLVECKVTDQELQGSQLRGVEIWKIELQQRLCFEDPSNLDTPVERLKDNKSLDSELKNQVREISWRRGKTGKRLTHKGNGHYQEEGVEGEIGQGSGLGRLIELSSSGGLMDFFGIERVAVFRHRGHSQSASTAVCCVLCAAVEECVRIGVGSVRGLERNCKRPIGANLFWGYWRSWLRTPHEDGCDGEGTAAAVQQQKTE
ncbi:hypothetical protein BY996DRAFT_8438220 [Phakopsora pachyrhizi]|nr:hypothetical protein BY996DRAFT_8438220 [Phakopsora pachyrhizi]